MAPVKDLYMGKSIEDLDKLLEGFADNITARKVIVLSKSCKKLGDDAIKSFVAGDEEASYVQFYKYFTVISLIRNHCEYDCQKHKITEILGGQKDQLSAIDKFEGLRVSLEKRYSALAEAMKQPVEDVKPIEPPIQLNERNYITCKELYERMMCNLLSLLIVDCRPKEDFLRSRIKHDKCINIDENQLQPGIHAGNLINFLNEKDKQIWEKRFQMDFVVLIDWNTRTDEFNTTSKLFLLENLMKYWELDSPDYKSLHYVFGGYEQFLTLYPSLTTNPWAQPPIVYENNTKDDLETIEYPSISDIVMKKETLKNIEKKNQDTPIVNRTLKPDNLKSSFEKKVEWEKARLELMKQAKALEAERKLKECQIIEALNKSDTASDEETKERETLKAKKLEYDLLELENNKQDLTEESVIVQEQIVAVTKEIECEPISPTEDFNETQKNRSAEKEREEKELVKLQNIVMCLRQQILEQKNQKLNETVYTEEKPPFDRKEKPLEKGTPKPVLDRFGHPQRDFKPEMVAPEHKPEHAFGRTGLVNIGNSCYMNTIIQCLSNTTTLKDCFITFMFRPYVNSKSKTKGRLVEELAFVIRALWSGNSLCITPTDFKKLIGTINPMYATKDQQDSHELLTLLIDWLHSELQIIPISPKSHPTPSEKAWLDFTNGKGSIILDLFYGQNKSIVKCSRCGYESATYEQFSVLSLELQDQFRTLEDCVQLYCSGETICGWRCPRCGIPVNAIKTITFSKLPPILVIHLKRFSLNLTCDEPQYQKNKSHVSYPLHNLDLTQYMTSSIRNSLHKHRTYNLYAVANHHGELNGGHYTAYCYNVHTKNWYKFNDREVSQLSTNMVISCSAYILFYSSVNLPDNCNQFIFKK